MDEQLRAQLVNLIAEAIAESGHGRSHTLEWCNGLAEAVLAVLPIEQVALWVSPDYAEPETFLILDPDHT